MSYDLKLATVCDHRIYKEALSLDTDRRTLRFSSPLASTNVDLFASDDLVSKNAYVFLNDPTQPSQSKTNRIIVLKDKWKSVEDFFELNYNTLNNYCPKCTGLDQIDDISYNVKGQLLTIVDERLLMQNVEKFTVTEQYSNPFHTFVGTGLVKLLGQRITNQSYIATKVTQEINSTLQVFKDLQRQYMSANRTMSSGEVLDVIENVKVMFDNADPSILRADIAVRAKSGKTVNFSQFLKIA